MTNVVRTMELKRSMKRLPTRETIKNALGTAPYHSARDFMLAMALGVAIHNIEYYEVGVGEYDEGLNEQNDNHREG